MLLPNAVMADDTWLEELRRTLPAGGVRMLSVASDMVQMEPLIRGDAARLRKNALTWKVQGRRAALDRRGVQELDTWVWGAGEVDAPLPWSQLETTLADESYRLDVKGRLRRSELRAFTTYVVEPLRHWSTGEPLSDATLGVLHAMGFTLHPVQDLDSEALALHRPTPSHPGEALMWAIRRVPPSVALAVPLNEPHASVASFARTVALGGGAQHVLLGNVVGRHPRAPGDTTTVRRSYYQRVLESLLAADQPVMSVRRAPQQEGGTPADVILTKSLGVADGDPPGYARAALEVLERAGLTHAWYDGDRATYRYRGSGDPLLDYARRLYPRSVIGVWLGDRARARFATRLPRRVGRWLGRLDLEVQRAELAVALGAVPADTSECALAEVQRAFEELRRRGNPGLLATIQQHQITCGMRAVRDLRTGRSFLVMHGPEESVALALVGSQTRSRYELKSPDEVPAVAEIGATEIRIRREAPP